MALDGTLKYWNDGTPVLPDDNLVDLKYWLNGEPYTIIQAAPPAGWTHKCLGVANASISKINGIAKANISKVNGT